MAQRDAEIVAAKMRGLSWSQISATYDVSVTRCKEIHRAYRESNKTLRHHDPLDIVDEVLEGYQGAVEELALISATTNSDTARVGAINSKMTAYQRIVELLQGIGVLPHDLGQLKVEVDARFAAEAVVAVLHQYNVSQEIQDALIEALEGRHEITHIEHKLGSGT